MDHSLGDEATRVPEDGDSLPGLQSGDVIERYRVIRLLGRGGMGQVYEVEHVELGTRHALKIIPSELAGQRGFIERFRREATVMAQLQHAGIVHVRDFACSEGRYWLQMDLVKGVPVGENLEGRPASAGSRPRDGQDEGCGDVNPHARDRPREGGRGSGREAVHVRTFSPPPPPAFRPLLHEPEPKAQRRRPRPGNRRAEQH